MMNDKFILADPNGKEIRYLEDIREMDIQLKDTGKENNDNTFEFSYDKKFHGECGDYGYRIYIPGTEYGGLMGQMKVDTKENQIIWTGNTWRGMLAKKIIVPAAGQDYRTVSGDLHTIMRQLINPEYGSLIRAPDTSCGVSIGEYQFARYTTLLEGLAAMLAEKKYKLQIRYIQTQPSGYTEVRAVPVVDYSDQIEFSQDYRVDFTATDNRMGINHLIVLGAGELKDRAVYHLYLDAEGNLCDRPYYTGIEERVSVYEYANAETEEDMMEYAKKRLDEIKSAKSFEMSLTEAQVGIGDIVGARDRITGMSMSQAITGEVLKMSGGKITVTRSL